MATRAHGARAWRRKADGVLDRLGLQIVAGRYAAGSRLPTEAELAGRLGISRPSLREALRALARKGLVESRPRRGTIALARERWDVLDRDVLGWMAQAPPDREFLIGLVEARAIFEPAAARLAAQRATPAQILAIEGAYRGMAEALPHDLEACNRHDLAFHEAIVSASGNVMLVRLAITIRTALLALRGELARTAPGQNSAVGWRHLTQSPSDQRGTKADVKNSTVSESPSSNETSGS